MQQAYSVTENPQPFALTVAPGATSPQGRALSLSLLPSLPPSLARARACARSLLLAHEYQLLKHAGSVAMGTSLSLITAGTIGSFVITARDSFENRRPGGDTINVLIVRWNVKTNAILNINEAPETGTVTDNSDGSLSPTPCTPHPTTCTLHPTPYTYTLNTRDHYTFRSIAARTHMC